MCTKEVTNRHVKTIPTTLTPPLALEAHDHNQRVLTSPWPQTSHSELVTLRYTKLYTPGPQICIRLQPNCTSMPAVLSRVRGRERAANYSSQDP